MYPRAACVIVIPIYKESLSKSEELSFRQVLNMLSEYPVFLVAPKGLSIGEYTRIAGNHKLYIQRFSVSYFTSKMSYNNLLMEKNFYCRFLGFEWMLIYQLDAYIFSSNLEYWCNKGYDYIGAPWVDNENIDAWNSTWDKVGNGGFSLRRIRSAIRVLQLSRQIVFPPKGVLARYKSFSLLKLAKRFPEIICSILGRKNNTHYYVASMDYNEDYFWGVMAQFLDKNFKSAPVFDALAFSFETQPSVCYRLNGNRLPFGCHAWELHEPGFWGAFIPSLRG